MVALIQMIANKSLIIKYKKMKNILIVLILMITSLSCKAQFIIPLEEAINHIDSENGLMGDKDYVYVKDINNLLNKYVGTWKGIYNSKNYEFRVIKITEDDGELKEDLLLVRYKITDSNGTIIENTINLPNDDIYVIKGSYLNKYKTTYVLYYQGRDSNCGQSGDLFIEVFGTNDTQMQLFLELERDLIDGYDCPNGTTQILPTESIQLIKQ